MFSFSGISVKIVVIGLTVLGLLFAGGYVVNEHYVSKRAKEEKAEVDAAIAQYRKQEKEAIQITKQRQVYAKKSEITDKEVYAEVANKPSEYDIALPESGRLLIDRAIDEANSYIHTID